jgi:3-isopropylmalate/(R)-2-methylmalate dehydratase small subunit
MTGLVLGGRCWRLGDDVSSDALISARHVFEYDPRLLRKHILAEVRPEFAAEARPGDLLVVGTRFAHGSQHSHPFIALKEMGVGLIARTLSRPAFRLAIYMGVPLLEVGEDARDQLGDGDRLQVDFSTGSIANQTTGAALQVEPLPAFLLEIVAAGGGLGHLKLQHAAA